MYTQHTDCNALCFCPDVLKIDAKLLKQRRLSFKLTATMVILTVLCPSKVLVEAPCVAYRLAYTATAAIAVTVVLCEAGVRWLLLPSTVSLCGSSTHTS